MHFQGCASEPPQKRMSMKKAKIVLTMTEYQFSALVDLADTISAMRGCSGDFSDEADRNIKAFDRMLKSNGYKRFRK